MSPAAAGCLFKVNAFMVGNWIQVKGRMSAKHERC